MSEIEVLFHGERLIKPEAVRLLYTSVGWWPERTEEQIVSVLNGDVAIGAWDADYLVGFARVISDHHFHAYIEDVVVHPAYQRRGIGKRLLTRLVDVLSDVDTVTLFCESELVSFYEEIGFRMVPSQKVLHRKVR